MNFILALTVVFFLMFILWLISIPIKNVSIVDAFWGMGFVVVNVTYIMEKIDIGGSVFFKFLFYKEA